MTLYIHSYFMFRYVAYHELNLNNLNKKVDNFNFQSDAS